MRNTAVIASGNPSFSDADLLRGAMRRGAGGVSIVTAGRGSERQVGVAERFAGRGGLKGAARYAGADWFRLGSGAWGLAGALAVIDCRIEEIIERRSHALVAAGAFARVAAGRAALGL